MNLNPYSLSYAMLKCFHKVFPSLSQYANLDLKRAKTSLSKPGFYVRRGPVKRIAHLTVKWLSALHKTDKITRKDIFRWKTDGSVTRRAYFFTRTWRAFFFIRTWRALFFTRTWRVLFFIRNSDAVFAHMGW